MLELFSVLIMPFIMTVRNCISTSFQYHRVQPELFKSRNWLKSQSCADYQSPMFAKCRSCKEVRFPDWVIGSERWCGLSLCAVPSQPFFISISWGAIKSGSHKWVMEDKARIRVRIRGVETVQVDIWTAKVQVKLLFKYSEFMTKSRSQSSGVP